MLGQRNTKIPDPEGLGHPIPYAMPLVPKTYLRREPSGVEWVIKLWIFCLLFGRDILDYLALMRTCKGDYDEGRYSS
jgi:hypothetical protein